MRISGGRRAYQWGRVRSALKAAWFDVGLAYSSGYFEVDSEEDLRSKISKRTAMIYILSGPAAEKGPLSIANICSIAKEKGIPVFVDAAAEEPIVPIVRLP